jgi:hypothetical protein
VKIMAKIIYTGASMNAPSYLEISGKNQNYTLSVGSPVDVDDSEIVVFEKNYLFKSGVDAGIIIISDYNPEENPEENPEVKNPVLTEGNTQNPEGKITEGKTPEGKTPEGKTATTPESKKTTKA